MRTGKATCEMPVPSEEILCPNGLGLVAEYAYARSRTTRPIKVPCPGPYTMADRLKPGAVYKDHLEMAYTLSELYRQILATGQAPELQPDAVSLEPASFLAPMTSAITR